MNARKLARISAPSNILRSFNQLRQDQSKSEGSIQIQLRNGIEKFES